MCCDRYQVCYYNLLLLFLYLDLHIKYFFLFWKGTLTQSIRNFAKGLESWLQSAMADCPEEMTQIKVYIYLIYYINDIRKKNI